MFITSISKKKAAALLEKVRSVFLWGISDARRYVLG